MDSLVIQGNQPLFGNIKISGAKNAALPIMAASLLTDKLVELTNIPKLTDIYTMKALLENHGAVIHITDQAESLNLTIDCSNIHNFIAPYDIVRKMRAGVWVLAPLLARFHEAKVSLPGGCAIGSRQVNLHIDVLKAMGAQIEIDQGYIIAKAKQGLKGTHFIFNKTSVGATITAIIAGCLAVGETILLNCAREPEIIDLARYLQAGGAEIYGVGTSEIVIKGKTGLIGAKYKIIPDRIEAGTYMIAAAITKGALTISNIDYNLIENTALKLIEAGIKVINHPESIEVKYDNCIDAVNIETEAYPGFSTDLQAQFMALMSVANGTSVITEKIFENRFMHVLELNRMGANIIVNDHSAVVKGNTHLTGAEVMASDLRASSSLVLAAIAAQGQTVLRRIYHLDRGYQTLEQKLNGCGANIVRIKG